LYEILQCMILLDAGGAFLIILPLMLLSFMIGTIFLEAWILYHFGYKNFRKSLKDSAIVNIISLLAGCIIVGFFPNMLGELKTTTLITFFAITAAIEAFLLTLLNNSWSIKNTIIPALLMNIASYLALVAIVWSLSSL
jgi:hypothetical protein